MAVSTPVNIVAVEIPLSSRPERFSVMLRGTLYTMRTYWLAPANCWCLNIGDQNNNLMIGGIALVTGADLIGQFGYIGLGGQMLTISDWSHDPSSVPQFNDFGTPGDMGKSGTGHLYFIVDA